MRWKLYRSGDERVITKFLWLPKTINRECRWLETVKFRQIYRVTPSWDILEFNHWENWEWIN